MGDVTKKISIFYTVTFPYVLTPESIHYFKMGYLVKCLKTHQSFKSGIVDLQKKQIFRANVHHYNLS